MGSRVRLPDLALLLVLAACGGGGGGDSPDATPAVCGNGVTEGAEECDDGDVLDDGPCSSSCTLNCGDGVIAGDEVCDEGIAAGMPGACPDDCNDDMACTTDQLTGEGCQRACAHGDITATQPGDGCCPAGANVNTDSDCPAGCGNGAVEAGETCDTAIAAGMPGACPTACDDGIACTTDTLFVPDTGDCGAICQYAEITTPAAGDECCPAGADSSSDSDCSGACGDGVVGAGVRMGAEAMATACESPDGAVDGPDRVHATSKSALVAIARGTMRRR
jgi:cysteine-rich repeat protein